MRILWPFCTSPRAGAFLDAHFAVFLHISACWSAAEPEQIAPQLHKQTIEDKRQEVVYAAELADAFGAHENNLHGFPVLFLVFGHDLAAGAAEMRWLELSEV
jgi:hypothetical protein